MTRVAVTFFVLLLIAGATPAAAAPIIGQRLLATGGEVFATYLGATAAQKNDLYLFDATDLTTPLAVTDIEGSLGKGVIFTNKETQLWETVSLGWFAPGQELVFGIHVRDTGQTYFLGPGSRNPDGRAHGLIDDGQSGVYPFHVVPPGQTGVGFEDLYGTASDDDFDDLVFAFSSVTTELPEPATLALFALGIATAGARRLRSPRE